MPTPRSDESESDFVSRCIPIVIDEGTAEDASQAAAVCHSMYDQKKKSDPTYRLVWRGGKALLEVVGFNGLPEDKR